MVDATAGVTAHHTMLMPQLVYNAESFRLWKKLVYLSRVRLVDVKLARMGNVTWTELLPQS